MSDTNRLWLVVVLCAVNLIAACNDDDRDSNTNADTARVDIGTAQAALTEISSTIDTTVTGFDATANGAAVTTACPGGGQANATGRVNVVPVPLNVDVSVTITYAACQTRTGAIMTGNLEFSQTVAAGSQPVRVETIYNGDVQFSGKVQARCAVDVNVLVDETGKTVSVNGKFCGYEASQLNVQVTPLWRR